MDSRSLFVVKALEGHDTKFLQKIATELKGSSGEGWAIGEIVERAISQYGGDGIIRIDSE